MTPARFRKLVLAKEGVSEVAHFDRAAFRTKRKIFATLGTDGRVNLVVEPIDRRDALLESLPEVFHDLGGWTRLGYVAVDLAKVDAGLFAELLEDAYRAALPVAKPRAARAKAPIARARRRPEKRSR